MIFFSSSERAKSILVLFLKGIAMGAANKIPGVSGGFIAFILGFYEKLIHSLKKINYSWFFTIRIFPPINQFFGKK